MSVFLRLMMKEVSEVFRRGLNLPLASNRAPLIRALNLGATWISER